jgi:photosystem II stability/assembly factor-like uncharacterized protein
MQMGSLARVIARSTWLALMVILALGLAAGARAQAPTAPDWELTGLDGRVLQLFTPASGAFLARTEGGLFRSDDAGATWRALGAPPALGIAAVDPTNHDVVYAAGAGGLHKTADAGATWSLVLPTTNVRVLNLAVSPADPALIYIALGQGSGSFQFLRSRDAGATWDLLEGPVQATLCGWTVLILKPHPIDPARVHRTSGCYAGRDAPSGDSLDHSRDQGATFTLLFHPRPLFTSRLVGGQGSAPGRFYLGAYLGANPGGGRLFRTDDDGATWREIFVSPSGPAIAGLTYAPAAPDRVWVGLASGAVKASANGGATWVDLGRQDLGRLDDLALGVDGRNLYAATEQGVWRLRLEERPPAEEPRPRPPVQIPAR